MSRWPLPEPMQMALDEARRGESAGEVPIGAVVVNAAGAVIGRGVCVENDTHIGANCKVQSNSYITAYSDLEDDVFIAPCVTTTNDNFMGRTEERHALIRGAARPV